jgi:hypothetical protein
MNEPQKHKTLRQFMEENFTPEFIRQCDDEYRRMEIVGSKHDREWMDSRLPGWEFFRSDYCDSLFVGINYDLDLTVQGSSESEVQEAAAEAEQVLAEDDAKEGVAAE